ncbi:fatty acid desaturase family protein [Peribacillus butanolivorans]|uniref:fatty acid desaturase family protein n=1 Tax=Peribacillus butanolivorans TaxID=421767 RepID=UPI0037C81D69
MNVVTKRRDYSITGSEKKVASEKGLVSAEWYTCPIPRKRLKQLMKRKDGPAIRDTLIWFGLLIISGILAYLSWGTWWAIPAFVLYGILYMTPADSRWHECGHGTAFKTPWMNEAVYQIASFMSLRPATPSRWSHTRHHTDTIIVGSDPEIIAPRPPVWRIIVMEIFHLYGGPKSLMRVVIHCFGKLDKEEGEYMPESEQRKTCWESRIWILIFAAIIAWCISMRSILPAMLIGLPTFYGSALTILLGITQHLGLKEDVLDHRLNSRTFYTNRIIGFLYWNMNYHIEHHMFPMVPYHALPDLHEEMKADCPQARPSFRAALKETLAAMLKQNKDPDYVIISTIPDTANPYRYGSEVKEPVPREGTSNG